MTIETSSLIKSVTTTYSRWPMGETRLLMVSAGAYGANQRLSLSQSGKNYKFISRLYSEVITRADPFFAEYFTYLDSINVNPVGNQTLTRYYNQFLSNKRVAPGSYYGIPFMRVK